MVEYERSSPMGHEPSPAGYWTSDMAARARVSHPANTKVLITLYPTAEACANVNDNLTTEDRCATLNSMREHSTFGISYRIEMAKRN